MTADDHGSNPRIVDRISIVFQPSGTLSYRVTFSVRWICDGQSYLVLTLTMFRVCVRLVSAAALTSVNSPGCRLKLGVYVGDIFSVLALLSKLGYQEKQKWVDP